MQKKQCPNGHVYDPDIYGDRCPLCPSGAQGAAAGNGSTPKTQMGTGPTSTAGSPGVANPVAIDPMKTHFGSPAPGGDLKTHLAGNPNPGVGNDPSGATKMRPQEATPHGGGRTVIRHAPGSPGAAAPMPERRLVGFLVTYNRTPAGKAYNIYEGRNYIGRDLSCDISVPDDGQMSGKHLSILYRTADNKFKFRDEQSTNGTFINKQLLDDGELQNYDVIRAGSTIFIFIAIPI
ncbi:MAG: FHA domain-containing protein [Muribaculaceae bacterium]|nr:FHA domain-containing protein [Muribaculaceae bacterium]